MREYGTVKTAFWTDPKVAAMSRDAKHLALYLLTSPHTNALGCFRVPLQYIAADMGEDMPWVDKTFNTLTDMGWCEYHDSTGWVWIKNYLRHNKPANGNVLKKCWREYEQVPSDVPFRKAVRNGLETVSKPSANEPETPEPEPEPYPEPEPTPPVVPPAKAGGKRVRKADLRYTPEFEGFWQVYPRKKAKRRALEAYQKAQKRAPPERILEGAIRHAAECEGKDDQYIPHPATWLNDDGWENEADHEHTRTINADRIDAIVNGCDPDAGYETGGNVWPALERQGNAGQD